MPDEFLSPEEARVMLEWRDRRNAALRAKNPEIAPYFPPVSDETWRRVMELALLGELPDPRELPPLANSPRSPDRQHN
jgi:hypothetical protein